MNQPLKAEKLLNVVELTYKEVGLPITHISTLEYADFENELTKAIQYLIDKDFEKLMHLLYRIDVSEAKVKMAFGLEKEVAREIALLIIDREQQKVITRAKYK